MGKKERNERLRKEYVICGLIYFYPGDWITFLSKNNDSSIVEIEKMGIVGDCGSGGEVCLARRG